MPLRPALGQGLPARATLAACPPTPICALISDLAAGVRPFDEREAADQADILAWVASGRQLFRLVPPDTPPKHLDVDLWFILNVARDEARVTPDPREFKSVRWFDVDGQRDWPAGRYDPEMHRFAAKLRSALEPAREEQRARKKFGRSAVT